MLTGTLKSLFALAEAYPDLKANQNFLQLQEELSGTESKIAYARQFYNDSVMSYNTTIQTFPNNLLAGPFGLRASGSTSRSRSRRARSRTSRSPRIDGRLAVDTLRPGGT